MSRPVHLKGFTIGKGGRVVRDEKSFNKVQQLKRRPGGSKKVRVKRKGAA